MGSNLHKSVFWIKLEAELNCFFTLVTMALTRLPLQLDMTLRMLPKSRTESPKCLGVDTGLASLKHTKKNIASIGLYARHCSHCQSLI